MDKRRLRNGTVGDGSTDGMVLVRFELPATVSATTVSVCGDFNEWHADAHPLSRIEEGHFRTDIVLPAGERYRFRYLLDGQRWENDPAADDYVPNGLGADDCVVDLTDTRSLPVIDATAVVAASGVPAGPAQDTQAAPTAPAGADSAAGSAAGSAASDRVARLQVRLSLQRVRLRPQTWERIEAVADSRGMETQDLIADLLEAAMAPVAWPVVEPLLRRKRSAG